MRLDGPPPPEQPLAGLLVVAIEQAIAAPFATRQLADMGARVIKLEREGGGDFARGYDQTVNGLSSHFVWANRSKESVTVDLKSPDGVALVRRLVARADVYVQNLAPGAAARMGISGAQLAAEHPRLIACDVSGYGAGGPFAQRKAYDLLVQCEAGVVSITGSEDEPAKAGIPVADIAGAMYAVQGILAALHGRERTGRGRAFEVSLFDALGEWMGYPWYFTHYGGHAPRRSGAHHAAIAPYGPVTTADGRQVVLAIQNEREWARFCAAVLARPELAQDPRFAGNARRVEHRAALEAAIADVTRTLPLERLCERLDAEQIAYGQIRDVEEFVAHPQLAARGRWSVVETPAGPAKALLPPTFAAGEQPRMDPVPALGEHTAAVRRSIEEQEEVPA